MWLEVISAASEGSSSLSSAHRDAGTDSRKGGRSSKGCDVPLCCSRSFLGGESFVTVPDLLGARGASAFHISSVHMVGMS